MNGAGYAKRSGQETAWERIGLDKRKTELYRIEINQKLTIKKAKYFNESCFFILRVLDVNYKFIE